MASDETRRHLKEFGIAVTDYEDAVTEGASREKVANAEAEVKARLAEVTALVQRLSARKK